MGDVLSFLEGKQPKSTGQTILQDAKFFMDYSRYQEPKQAFESWSEATGRVMNMHRDAYAHCMSDQLEAYIEHAEKAYQEQRVLAAQRTLQFGGEQIFKHNAKIYNCSASYADRPVFFQQAMYLLLCGVGVGFSVQRRHTSQIPAIESRSNESRRYVVDDSIEGWKNAFGVLISSYLTEGAPFPEYQGCHVSFDLSEIRPKGAFISGGFKAPGPEGLRNALVKCEALLESVLKETNKLRPIHIYDFVMHMADAVLSGGVRRSATICLFDKDDEEMLNAKTGDWFIHNPQRGRSNNSAVLKRDELTWDEWERIMEAVRDYGEPGFVFTDDLEFLFNPLNVAA